MSGFAGILIVVGILTALGAATLIVITLKYYWGTRGRPPLSREERRAAREQELTQRANQIEYSRKHPRAARKPDFWDNGKVSTDKKNLAHETRETMRKETN